MTRRRQHCVQLLSSPAAQHRAVAVVAHVSPTQRIYTTYLFRSFQLSLCPAMLVHQLLSRCNLSELSGDLLEGIKAAVGLTCVESMSCDERLGEHHHCHMMVEPTPGAALELVSTQYLIDIKVVLFDRPPKVSPLDEVVETPA